jgi:hypothetical protein
LAIAHIRNDMIWNDEFLFLHYPRAAGKSLSVAFVRAWPTPVKGYVSAGQLAEFSPFVKRGSVFWVEGNHQNTKTAAKILDRFGFSLSQFCAIFVAVRCPYDLAYSTYKFLRLHASHVGVPAEFSQAAIMSFEEFVTQLRPSDYRSWFQHQDCDLPNLRVIRFEAIKTDLKAYANEFGFRNLRIPHLNASGGESYLNVMTPALENAIYDKYRFLFERGYYSRLATTRGTASP